jgi:hypothetical protein
LSCKPHGRNLYAPTPNVIANGFTHPCTEESMKMKWGKMSNFSQSVEVKRLIKMLIDVSKYSMHTAFVF